MPLVAGLVVLFLGWWKQWGIDPLAHPNRLNPLSEAPTQTPGKADKQGELKDNQKQKYQPIS